MKGMLLMMAIGMAIIAQAQSDVSDPGGVSKAPDADEVFLVCEQMPRFPGCEDLPDNKSRETCAQKKMWEFVYSNLRYPKKARSEGIEGTVVISFIIERDGTLSNINIAREIGGGCGEEGLRVVQLMNKKELIWVPGEADGVPVRTEFKLPLKFKLQ